MNKVIHLISGPRNLSTALMYAFANRDDFSAVDEPYYAHYLHHNDIDYHPGRSEVINSQSVDAEEVTRNVVLGNYDTPYLFVKNMAQHLDVVDMSFMHQVCNIFYIRHPKRLITSFAKIIENPTIEDIGIKKAADLLQLMKDDDQFVVLDSGNLLSEPERILRLLCEAFDIPFSEKMLSWPPGPKPADGVWAKYWYGNVHKSTHFKKQKSSSDPMPKHLEPLYEEAMAYYDVLLEHAIN